MMDAKTRTFLMVVRKVLLELLGALEDFLSLPRSIKTSRERYKERGNR